jgi:hypothetical protein
MGAPKGNQFWKARARHGRDKIFSTPDALWDSACEYFQWVEDNPIVEYKVTQFKGDPVDLESNIMRAMTEEGLCVFMGVNTRYLSEFNNRLDLNTDEGKDFSTVIDRIKGVIREQKFTGAAAGVLNPNIIARDLGLRDDQKVDHTSSDGSMSPADSSAAVLEALKAKHSK